MKYKLGDFFKQRKGFIQIEDTKEYKRCRLQVRARGIVLRDIVPGSKIKTKKQQVCLAGDFVVAEIDAKVGGFGFIPNELDGSIVSSHYFIFEIDESTVLAEYFALIIKLEAFQSKFRARGSTNYAAIRPHDFLNIDVEIPNPTKQTEIVNKYKKASKLEEKIKNQLELLDELKEKIIIYEQE
ncbi:restriction endonuclease subunit S [Candidatus Woesebacteria bacterium]|nr:restriction endonuclease subunit S [Candidatus Woesebacteria bacterium]